jgi:hypothetical protein
MPHRKTIIRRVALIVLTMLAFFVSILEMTPTKVISENTQKYKKPSLEGISDVPLDLGANQNFCEAFYNSRVKMDIDFIVNATTLSNRWSNIFQTDDVNSGFRIEISSDGVLSAVVQSPDGGSEQLLGVVANGVVKAKTLTKINISVYSNTITVKIDDGEEAYLAANFRPTCNRVLIGGGFDDTRTTIGDVQAVVRLQTLGFETTFGMPVKTREIARVIFTLLMVGIAFEYRKKLFKSNDNKVEN